MGVNVSWDSYHTTLCLTYTKGWSQVDLGNASAHALEMLNQSARPVQILIDLLDVRLASGEFISHAGILKPITQHPQARHVVVVGAAAETQEICQSYPAFRHYHFAATQDEGFDLVSQLDYLTSIENLYVNAG